MMSSVKFEQKNMEVNQSSLVMIVVLCVIEAALIAGIYFLAESAEGAEKYIFLCVAIFFFIALALGLLPLVNNALSGKGLLMWSATATGLLVPATTSGLATTKPPLFYSWSDIDKIVFVDELTEHSDDNAVSWNRLLIFFTKKIEMGSLQHGCGNCKILDYPKKHKLQIHQKLTALAPKTICIELLNKYHI